MKTLLLLLSITLLASACSTDKPIEKNFNENYIVDPVWRYVKDCGPGADCSVKERLDYERYKLKIEDEKQQAKDKEKQEWCKANASDKYAQQLCKEIK